MTEYIPLSDAEIAKAKLLFETVVVPVMAQDHKDAGDEERNGAILNIRDPKDQERLHFPSGTATEEKFAGYATNGKRKNFGLGQNPECKSSWEIHKGNLDLAPFPGGIRTPVDDRFAISGFSWQRDEAGSLWLAYKLGRIRISEAYGIANLSGNRQLCITLFSKMDKAVQAA